ncbi:hypothetical protein C8A00DRAFT_33314 [Chaetomidium leptoderma]|uniref:C3H1-type domain-containing protein n=1 Tax=Chaetomidium leptoderma TaxID=669021 RepID=A0AAN6VLR6_9PEZI|nr:hypothetical protein C8A00DRAFT_33314 [Chaetomidium leptoderma]
MDALRGLNPTESFPTEHHGVSQHHGLEAGSPLAGPSAENLNTSPPPLDIRSTDTTMKASLPSTPSRLNSQQLPLDSNTPSPRAAAFDPDRSIQRLADYCAELKALMGNNDMDPNPNAHASNDNTSPSDDDRLPYRHGQMGVFRPFPRFDQASRSIASGNWRAKNATESLMTGSGGGGDGKTSNPNSNPLSPVTPSQARSMNSQQPPSPFGLTPIRSPLAAPADANNMAGFTQSSNPFNHPPTPVSLSTPLSMTFPGRGNGHGGHAHHSSAGSFGASTSGYSPSSVNMTPSSVSTDLVASQISSLSLRGANNTPMNHGHDNGNGHGHATFPVTLPVDTLGYCFVRPNGTRTRLVPVDMLPYPLRGIPAQESGNDRLVALPVPAGVSVDGRSSNTQALAAAVYVPRGNNGGGGGGGDAIQSQIDRILAAPPSTSRPPPSSSSPSSSSSSIHSTNPNNHLLTPSQTQLQPQTQNPTSSTTKRMKIYCDKWVHEGVCAFTQQGCKYKHEMPSDKATQHQLGLFLGYPVWWKRRQAELARVQTQPPSPAPTPAQTQTHPSTQIHAQRRPAWPSSPGLGGLSSGGVEGVGQRVFPRPGGDAVDDHETEDGERTAGRFPSQYPRRNAALNGGLAASRWGSDHIAIANTNNANANANRDKLLLRPSWRTVPPTEGRHPPQQHDYPEQHQQGLQCYDGAGSGSGSSHDGHELVPYRPSMPGERSHDPRVWPWEEQHYIRRASQTQQQQQQYHPDGPSGYKEEEDEASSGFGGGGGGGGAACSFAFHSTTNTPTTSSSLYGPIAPPMRNSSNSNGNNTPQTNNNNNNNTSAGPRPALEMPNPYAMMLLNPRSE